MEIFTPSRETITYKRNLNSLSIAIIVVKFIGIEPNNLPYLGGALENIPLWKVDLILIVALGIFGIVYGLTWWRDWVGWKEKEGIEGEEQDQIYLEMKLILGQFSRAILEGVFDPLWGKMLTGPHRAIYNEKKNELDSLKNKFDQAPKTAANRIKIWKKSSRWSDQVIPWGLVALAVGFSVFRLFV